MVVIICAAFVSLLLLLFRSATDEALRPVPVGARLRNGASRPMSSQMAGTDWTGSGLSSCTPELFDNTSLLYSYSDPLHDCSSSDDFDTHPHFHDPDPVDYASTMDSFPEPTQDCSVTGINPASGLAMMDDFGVDVAGNPYGTSLGDDSFV